MISFFLIEIFAPFETQVLTHLLQAWQFVLVKIVPLLNRPIVHLFLIYITYNIIIDGEIFAIYYKRFIFNVLFYFFPISEMAETTPARFWKSAGTIIFVA